MHNAKWSNAYRFINPRIDATGVHVWPFDHAFPLEIHFWTYDRPSDIRMNRHDYFELILMDRGRAVFQVQDSSVTVNQGDLFIVGSTLFHRLIYSGERLKAPRIMFLPQLICPLRVPHEDADYLLPFLIQDDRFPHVVPASTGIPKQVRRLMLQIAGRLPAESAAARLCAKTYLKLMLALLVDHYASYSGSTSTALARQRDLDRLRPIFSLIENCYREPIRLEEAASLVSMSSRNFTRFFRRITGQTFVAYLNGFRIEKARRLLAEGNRTIAEVSQEVGFSDQSYFGVVFRRLVNSSAQQYAERVASERK
jgi:AraC-like DNA-binding protein